MIKHVYVNVIMAAPAKVKVEESAAQIKEEGDAAAQIKEDLASKV